VLLLGNPLTRGAETLVFLAKIQATKAIAASASAPEIAVRVVEVAYVCVYTAAAVVLASVGWGV
jgi:hypothetical protein